MGENMNKTIDFIFKDKKEKLKKDNMSEYGYNFEYSNKNKSNEDYSKVYLFTNKKR